MEGIIKRSISCGKGGRGRKWGRQLSESKKAELSRSTATRVWKHAHCGFQAPNPLQLECSSRYCSAGPVLSAAHYHSAARGLASPWRVAALVIVTVVLPTASAQCGPGTYFYAGACYACNEGTYKNAFDWNDCNTCPSGTFASWGCTVGMDVRYCAGAVSCSTCPAGLFSVAASPICCPQGWYVTGGYYYNYGNCCGGSPKACAQCPPGLTTPASNPLLSGSAGCTGRICGAGSGYTSSGSCAPCQPGTFAGADDPLFTGSPQPGCYSCPAGKFANATGGTMCNPCPVGFYAYAGSPICTACPTGYTTSTTQGVAIADCSLCAPGFSPSFSGGGASSLTCTAVCAAGFYAPRGAVKCMPCPPGTYSLEAAAACDPCPAGTFGSSAALASPACSGLCASMAACPRGTAYPPPPAPITDLSCASSGVRAVPASLGLLLWPAAHPSNYRHEDLIVAKLDNCLQLGGTCSTAPSDVIIGGDGVPRYIVDTAAALHLEAAEALACTAL